jgi:hypothetical protein
MARPRKPTAELELRGAFRKDPQRRRVDPETNPLGEPPPGMSEEIQARWFELAEQAPLGVLRSRDRVILECAAYLLHRRRTVTDWPMAEQAQLTKCLSLMGMTPSDASKVHAPKEKPVSAFSKFARKVSQARKDPAPVH